MLLRPHFPAAHQKKTPCIPSSSLFRKTGHPNHADFSIHSAQGDALELAGPLGVGGVTRLGSSMTDRARTRVGAPTACEHIAVFNDGLLQPLEHAGRALGVQGVEVGPVDHSTKTS